MYTVDIDVGGTFTDGFFTGDGRVASCKVPTTPHDLTVCFIECIEEGARNMGLPLAQMLRQTAVIRLSTTVGTSFAAPARSACLRRQTTSSQRAGPT